MSALHLSELDHLDRDSEKRARRKKHNSSLIHYTSEMEEGRKSSKRMDSGRLHEGSPGQDTMLWNSKIYRVTFSCSGLNVYTRPRRRTPRKNVLTNIDTIFKPGTTTALMGPSGAGKTSLLNVLSGRTQSSLVVEATSLMLNGNKLTTADVKDFSCLVPQDDILIPVLTPRELITYAARLVLNVSDRERRSLINKTLKVLSLRHCADTMCGDADTKGISGGERKRTSIGLELITNPSCIFLDEPTSGLDSKVALDVISTMRDLAAEGRTIVCTIHQPSYESFQKFDRLLLLNKGTVAFQGRLSEVTNYFESVGKPCPQYSNPADHILNVVSEEDFKIDFRDHELYEEFMAYSQGVGLADPVALSARKTEKKSEFVKIPILMKRSAYVTFKDKKQLRTRFMQVFFVGLIAGLTYLQLSKAQKASLDRQSSFLMITIFISMSSIMSTINSIPVEKTMLKREYNNGAYSVTTFWVSRTVVYYFFQALYISVYAVLVYFLIGFTASVGNFLTFYVTILIAGCIAVSLGFAFGAIVPTVQQATALVPMILLPLILFSGLLVSFESIPIYFVWIYYISFLQYVYRILVVNEFESMDFEPCSAEDFNQPGRCPFGKCLPPGNPDDLFSAPCPGDLVLVANGFDEIENFESFLIISGYLLASLIFSFVAIYNLLNPGGICSPKALFDRCRGEKVITE